MILRCTSFLERRKGDMRRHTTLLIVVIVICHIRLSNSLVELVQAQTDSCIEGSSLYSEGKFITNNLTIYKESVSIHTRPDSLGLVIVGIFIDGTKSSCGQGLGTKKLLLGLVEWEYLEECVLQLECWTG